MEDEAGVLQTRRVELIALATLSIVVFSVFGTLNVFAIKCIGWGTRLSRSPVFTVIAYLSWSDALACFLFYPLQTASQLYRGLTLRQPPAVVCLLMSVFAFPTVLSPGSVQLLIAVNRLVAVFWPTRYRALFPIKRSLTLFLVSFATPTLFLWSVIAIFRGELFYLTYDGRCSIDASKQPWSALIVLVLIAPIVVSFGVYAAIYVKIRVQRSPASRTELRRRARMMFAHSCVYLLCALPAPIANANGLGTFERNGYLVSGWLGVVYGANFGLNVIIYAVFNEQFRQHASDYYKWLRGRVAPENFGVAPSSTAPRAAVAPAAVQAHA